jgi:predicted ATPase/transcriptional regulator with XRE-family HTH domain
VESASQEPVPPAFGTLLRHHRIAAGLSLEELAVRAGVSANGIGALERGHRRSPQKETLALLTAALMLEGDALKAFEAAARSPAARRHEPGSLAGDGWPIVSMPELPLALTTFVGRESELGEITGLLRDHRLVTITGAGGVGKTQTALRVCTALPRAVPVCFASLAPLREATLVTDTIASALGVQVAQQKTLHDALLTYLKSKALLLLLDNCEHVVHESATVVASMLRHCRDVRILCTSREPLRVAGEHTYRLPSLQVPSIEQAREITPSGALDYGAIALFVDRARAADHAFELTDENVSIVADICRRLDSIPLALELAAARANLFSPQELAAQLDDRFYILTKGERSALPRQQTMRATIGWSYDLLTPLERRFFERLSVFAGGCTIATVTPVCAEDDVPSESVFDVLPSLVDKSLLGVDLNGSQPRYQLLDSFRTYAHEKLVDRGEAPVVAHRHALTFLDIAERLNSDYDWQPDDIWNESAKSELDNWRAALHWSLVERGDVALGQRLAGALVLVWTMLAPFDGQRWIATARGAGVNEIDLGLDAQFDFAQAFIAGNHGEVELQLASSVKALATYRALGDDFKTALCLSQAGRALAWLGRVVESEELLQEAIALARRLGLRKHLGHMLRGLSFASNVRGDFAMAREYVAEAIAIYEQVGARRGAAMALFSDLAEVELHAGNADLALDCALEAVPTLRAFNSVAQVAEALATASACCVSLRRYDDAWKYAREALLLAGECGATGQLVRALQRLIAVAVLSAGDASQRLESPAKAARILGFLEARLTALGSPRYLYDREEYARVAELLEKNLGGPDFQRNTNDGSSMSEHEAIDDALDLGYAAG